MQTFDEVITNFEKRLEPDQGYGWCSWTAQNPLAFIDANCGKQEKLRDKKPLMRLIQAMSEEAAKVGWETEYGAKLEIVIKYLHHVHDFLLIKDDPRQDVANDPAKLTWKIDDLTKWKEKLSNLKGFDRSSMFHRIDDAITWCSARREQLTHSTVHPKSSTGCAVAVVLCIGTVGAIARLVLYP